MTRRSPGRAPGRHGWRASRTPRLSVSTCPGSAVAPASRGSGAVSARPLEPEGARKAVGGALERSSTSRGRPARGVKRNPSTPCGPVGLQVGAPDEPVAEQQGQDVVAVHALVLALVDLDHVVEAEQAPENGRSHIRLSNGQRSTAAPARRRARRRAARERRPPSSTSSRAQPALRDERVDVGCGRALPPSAGSARDRGLGQGAPAPRPPAARTSAAELVLRGAGASSACFGITRSGRS